MNKSKNAKKITKEDFEKQMLNKDELIIRKKTGRGKKLERLREKAKRGYFEKHGRYPEEDGVIIKTTL